MLVFVSIFIMSNTIKLATFGRREEIAIMKMVGASNTFIRLPFVVEGLVLGILGGGAVVFWLLVQIYKLIANLVRKLVARLRKFTENVGEEYRDEQESLFDWGETKKELGEGLRKRLERLTKREKKWEQMDAREKVRFIVRSLYRKTPDNGNLRSLTVHEALKNVRTGQAVPQELASLYDTARYSQHEPDMEITERIRKEAKV